MLSNANTLLYKSLFPDAGRRTKRESERRTGTGQTLLESLLSLRSQGAHGPDAALPAPGNALTRHGFWFPESSLP